MSAGDFIGDGPEQAVSQCCEGCVRLQADLVAAVRRHRELHDAVLRLVKPWFVVSAVLADHAVEDATKGKEGDDEASKG